ncbi:MAG: hypothetical protein QXU47_03975 [Candidatus Bathyarchaeia archaeon]
MASKISGRVKRIIDLGCGDGEVTLVLKKYEQAEQQTRLHQTSKVCGVQICVERLCYRIC